MTAKVYINEYAGLAQTAQSDSISAVAEPVIATQILNTAATTGAIQSPLGAITAGTLYTNGVYPNVPLTGGTGSGATANITVSGAGVTAVALVKPGTGYTVADSLSAAAANIGGTGSGFAVAVSAIAQVSAAFNALTRFVEISADGICNVLFAANGNPVATTATGSRLNANERLPLRGVPTASVFQGVVTTGYIVSAVTNT